MPTFPTKAAHTELNPLSQQGVQVDERKLHLHRRLGVSSRVLRFLRVRLRRLEGNVELLELGFHILLR